MMGALPLISLAVALGACAPAPGLARNPPPVRQPAPGQLGCFQVLGDKSVNIDLPPRFRDHIPAQMALTPEPDNQFPLLAGWRLAALGEEEAEATRALRDGSWWLLERGGIYVQLADGSSGVGLSLEAARDGFEGEARTYSDIGDNWFRTPVRLDRIACPHPPTIIERRGVTLDVALRKWLARLPAGQAGKTRAAEECSRARGVGFPESSSGP